MTRRNQLMFAALTAVGFAVAAAFCSNAVLAEKEPRPVPKLKKELKQKPAEEAPEKIITTFMRAKLDASKDVLDGVVTENFVKIKSGAEKLVSMSRAAEWNAIQGPVYAQYSSEFRRSAERLMKEAEGKDIDGAGLAYMQLTMNCVSCHKYVKGSRVAEVDEPQIQQLSGANHIDVPAKR